MRSKADTLTFASAVKPDLVNVDGDKVLLAEKKDGKSLSEFAFQYANAPLYLDRLEAIQAAAPVQTTDKDAQKIIISALSDKYYGLRAAAVAALTMTNDQIRNAAQPILTNLAQTDPNTIVRANAIAVLGKLKASGMMNLFMDGLKSESYAVQAASLNAITQLDAPQGFQLAKGFEKDNKGALTNAILSVYAANGTDAEWPFVYAQYKEAGAQTKYNLARALGTMAGKLNSSEYAQQAISELKAFGVQYKTQGIAPNIVTVLEGLKAARTQKNDTASVAAADEAIKALK